MFSTFNYEILEKGNFCIAFISVKNGDTFEVKGNKKKVFEFIKNVSCGLFNVKIYKNYKKIREYNFAKDGLYKIKLNKTKFYQKHDKSKVTALYINMNTMELHYVGILEEMPTRWKEGIF